MICTHASVICNASLSDLLWLSEFQSYSSKYKNIFKLNSPIAESNLMKKYKAWHWFNTQSALGYVNHIGMCFRKSCSTFMIQKLWSEDIPEEQMWFKECKMQEWLRREHVLKTSLIQTGCIPLEHSMWETSAPNTVWKTCCSFSGIVLIAPPWFGCKGDSILKKMFTLSICW